MSSNAISANASDGFPAGDERRSGLDTTGKKRWVRTIVVLGVVAIISSAIFFLPVWKSWKTTSEALTYTISRSDLLVTVTEQGTLESSENTEIKCKVRGTNTIIWVIKGGTHVEPGDELVRLDTLALDEAISERVKFAHLTRSSAERLRANVTRAELAIKEYLEGRFQSEIMSLEKELAVADANLRSAEDWVRFSKLKAGRGFANQLELEEKETALKQAQLDVEMKKTEIDVLSRYTKAEELETLKGNLAAAKASYDAEFERSKADASRRDRAIEELKHCVVKADRSGLVIYPSAAQWKGAPDIEEGANVHKDQVMLLMPDLDKMQVKVGVHESMIERVHAGLAARVFLPNETLEAKVSSVASVTRPAGWWTGNVVKYDTIIELPKSKGLKPGMSAEVEIILAEHKDVLTIPVAAVVATEKGDYCWVQADGQTQRRALELGDSNDVFIVVKSGLKEGDQVVLNPLAHIDEAQVEVLKPRKKEDGPGKKDQESKEKLESGSDENKTEKPTKKPKKTSTLTVSK